MPNKTMVVIKFKLVDVKRVVNVIVLFLYLNNMETSQFLKGEVDETELNKILFLRSLKKIHGMSH